MNPVRLRIAILGSKSLVRSVNAPDRISTPDK